MLMFLLLQFAVISATSEAWSSSMKSKPDWEESELTPGDFRQFQKKKKKKKKPSSLLTSFSIKIFVQIGSDLTAVKFRLRCSDGTVNMFRFNNSVVQIRRFNY